MSTKVKDIGGMIQALVAQKRAIISDGSPEGRERTDREIARLKDRIQRDTAEVERLLSVRLTWRDQVEAIDQRLAELQQEKLLRANGSTVERLEDAAGKLEAMVDDMTPDQRAALLAVLTGGAG